MCGLVGKVSLTGAHAPVDRDLLAGMVGAIRHRGPDSFGCYRDGRAALGHARLALVDLVTGQQPLSNEDGTWWVVFNGEIYNYVELRRELTDAGHRFRTSSDTEVIVHAYEQWGLSAFDRFNGQWALALWSSDRHELVLSRDPVGICPLFVHEHGGRVWFASEIKALFADPEVPRELDLQGVAQAFTYWSPVAPTTAFAGIDELEPGASRRYAGGRVEEVHSTRLHFERRPTSLPTSVDDAAAELLDLLRAATRLRIDRADVPVGSYLSGGLDSSVIARLGASTHDGRFATFSLRFDQPEFDETEHQRAMAATLESEHVEVLVRPSDIAAVLPAVVDHAERPLLRTAPAPLFLLSRLVHEAGYRAVITGEGADEVLGGYDIFREAKIREFWARRPESTVRPLLLERIYPYLARNTSQARRLSREFWGRGLDRVAEPGFSHLLRWEGTAALQRFFAADVRASLAASPPRDPLDGLPEGFGSWDPLSRAQHLEVRTLLAPYVISAQGDRQLMANSVEGRFPFLDPDVIRFARGLPAGYLLRSLDEKHILRRAARDLVPESIVRRRKQPYRAPDAACFLGPDEPEYVGDALSRVEVERLGVFDPTMVERLAAKCRRALGGAPAQLSNADDMAVVGILSTQLLARLIDGRLPARTVSFDTDVDRVTVTTDEDAHGRSSAAH